MIAQNIPSVDTIISCLGIISGDNCSKDPISHK